MVAGNGVTRRQFLGRAAAAAAAPLVLEARAVGANDRITMGCIGVGGRGLGDMKSFLGFKELRVVAVCDVVKARRDEAQAAVNAKYGDRDCAAFTDYRELLARPDIDVVMIATPDHWHVLMAIEAMRSGKDVFCEKPETLTVAEGRELVNAVKRYARVYSGGSQRVWEDYQWFHRMIYSGAAGEVREVYVNCGGPPAACDLPAQPVPEGLDWDLWVGPAPAVPFNHGRLNFRPWRDYSGGGMTDWGAHGFGGALFACGLQHTGPVEVLPPNGHDVERLTVRFANGVRMFHGGGWGDILSFTCSNRDLPRRGQAEKDREPAPDIDIPNYHSRGGLFGDFVHCVRTREQPFRHAEVAHRTVTVCHLANLAYWLKRPLRWDPDREEIVGDPEASRLLDRPRRAPWTL